jgi:hypothetical protein
LRVVRIDDIKPFVGCAEFSHFVIGRRVGEAVR